VIKAKLLSTAAVALLFSAGVASAQGMGKETPERAPAAQQNAPAEKVAPSMKSDHKAPQTIGQPAPDAKSGKAKETTGQAPKSDVDQKAQAPSRSMDKDSKPGAAATGASKTEQNAQSPRGSKSTQSTSEQDRTTTGQGAAGSAKLTNEQRTKITSVIKEQKVERVNLNVSVSVGTRIPAGVRLHPLPQQVIIIYPEWRGYDYILVGDQIVIINPRTHEIVAIVEA
jgi:outer membrane biosynthesis protein TonB